MVLANIGRMSRAACSGRIVVKNRKEKEAEFIRISKLEEVNDLTKFSEVDTKREIRKLQSFTGTSKLVHCNVHQDHNHKRTEMLFDRLSMQERKDVRKAVYLCLIGTVIVLLGCVFTYVHGEMVVKLKKS